MSFFDIKSPSAGFIPPAPAPAPAPAPWTGSIYTPTVTPTMTSAHILKAQMMEYMEAKKVAKQVIEYGYHMQVSFNSNRWELIDRMTCIPFYDYRHDSMRFTLEEITLLINSGALECQPWNAVDAAIELCWPKFSATQQHEAELTARDYYTRLNLCVSDYERRVATNKVLAHLAMMQPVGFNPYTLVEDPNND